MPHLCVYVGDGKIVGMLRGKVRYHKVSRFLRNEYDLQAVRADIRVLREIETFMKRRESKLDLMTICVMRLLKLLTGFDIRNSIAYHMHGVTCSGIVSSAMHAAYTIPSEHNPLLDTPRDVEKLINRIGLKPLFALKLV
jgi:hypothetical protein